MSRQVLKCVMLLLSRLNALRHRYLHRMARNRGYTSYAQSGEDMIARAVLESLGIPRPTYLDIGAYDPIHLSNTYHFYRMGCAGVLIEPNPVFARKLKRLRPRDTVLDAGIAPSVPHTGESSLAPQGRRPVPKDLLAAAPTSDFYVMSAATLSTFSEADARELEAEGNYQIASVLQVPIVAVNDLLPRYFPEAPDFVSLDIEGLDMDILQAWDFERFRPAVLCVETISFSDNRLEVKKNVEMIEYLVSQNYRVHADTNLNTLFVDNERWNAV